MRRRTVISVWLKGRSTGFRRGFRTVTRWLLRPSSRWIRIPAGVLLVCGGLLSILPLLGLWMLPLGLVLLAEDAPPLKRARNWLLDFTHRHRPHWFAADQATQARPAAGA